MHFERSNAHMERALRLIPGGSHTYAKGDDQYPEGMAPVALSGSGCRMIDLDGNEFVEFGGGLRLITLGHDHPAIHDAIAQHLSTGINFVRPHVLEAVAAERLADLIPSAEMVKFGLSGSDATTAALRLARAYTGRDIVAVCQDHPIFSTDDWFMATTPMSSGVPQATSALTVGFRYNDLDSLAAVFEAHPGRVAAVFMEAETTQPPADGWFAGVRRLCDQHGAVFVLDEIITGFRWHLRGAQHVYGIEPDLNAFGKGICNGFPLSALCGRREIMRLGGFVEDRDRVFLLSQTGAAQPWALAAMMAVIDVYEQVDVVAQLASIGARVRAEVGQVIADAGLADHVTLVGRAANLVFATRDQQLQPSQEFRTLLLQWLLLDGVIASSLVVCAAHDDAAIRQTVGAIAAAMEPYARALEDGVGSQLCGRPVQPALRRRG